MFAADSYQSHKEGDGMIRWTEFRKNYCKHQGAFIEFEEGKGAVLACCYKGGKSAECWSDWQPCMKENCPALKEKQDGEKN